MKKALLIAMIASFAHAGDLPNSLKICKFQDSQKLISLDVIEFQDNIGPSVEGCPREMVYKYTMHSNSKTKILRLDSAQFDKCYYGMIV